MPSREVVLGGTAILIYHLYQILTFSRHLSTGSPSCDYVYDRSGRLLEERLPELVYQLPFVGGGTRPYLQQRVVDLLPEERTTPREYTCERWNTTFVFPQAPTFIIIGTQKGGTSALAAVLDHHPWMESSHYFEPHFFDFAPSMLHYRLRLNDPESMCRVLRDYLQKNFNLKRLRKYPNLIAFEKTPAYVLTPNAPARIKAVVPWAKIVVALRNPVDRLISQHKMTVERGWENRSFAVTVAEDLSVMRHEGFWLPHGDPFHSTALEAPVPRLLRKYKTEGMLYRGLYARQLLPWLEYYTLGHDLLVVRYEELRDNPTKVLNIVTDFVGAPQYDFPEDIVNKSYSPRSNYWLNDYRPNVTQQMREYLCEFYKPYNDELVGLLGEDWRGVWDA